MKEIQFHPEVVVRHPANPSKSDYNVAEVLNYFQAQDAREVLYTSSPSLYRDYEKWEDGKINEKQKAKLILSLYKYLLRMNNRSTPFGLLSSIGFGTLKDIDQSKRVTKSRRKTKLDSLVLKALIRKLEKNIEIREGLRYISNSTLYKVGENYRYIGILQLNSKEDVQIKSIPSNSLNDELIDYCQENKSYEEAQRLFEKYTDDKSEQEAYWRSLIDNQVLISELELRLDSEDNLSRIISIVKRIADDTTSSELEKIKNLLIQLQLRLIRIDKHDSIRISAYKAVIVNLKKLDFEFDESFVFQINQFSSLNHSKCRIQNGFEEKKLKQLISFLAICKGEEVSEQLKSFKEKFRRKYGECSIPLMQLVDPELELGYGNNSSEVNQNAFLLNEINLPYKGSPDSYRSNSIPNQLLSNFKTLDQSREITLSKEVIEKCSKKILPSLPATFSILFSIVKDEQGKRVYLLKDVGGHHGIHYLSRFSTDSDKAKTIALDLAKHEELMHNEELLELYHLSQGRAANINERPSFYKRCLHFLHNPKNVASKIPLSELRISLEEDRFIIHHKDSDKKVLPRLSSAHDFRINTLPLYSLLGELQSQESIVNLNFDWGVSQKSHTYFPRVRCASFIISPQRWVFQTSQLKREVPNEQSIEKWLLQNDIPRKLNFVDGDKELVVDFNCSLGKQLFLSLISKSPQIQFQECFEVDESCIYDEMAKGFHNEVIVFVKNFQDQIDANNIETPSSYNQANMPPGKEWLYFKVYCNVSASNHLLVEVHSLLKGMQRKGLIDKWFFIRYRDPDHHLRIRLHIRKPHFFGEICDEWSRGIQKHYHSAAIWKLQMDTYQREVARYGTASIEIAESLFYLDSECLLRFLKSFQGAQREMYKWQMCALIIDDWLELFGLKPNEKHDLIKTVCYSLRQEFDKQHQSKSSLAKSYRKRQNDLKALFSKCHNRPLEMKVMSAIVAERNLKMAPLIDELISLKRASKLKISLVELLKSYMHMSCNRLYSHSPRVQEFVTYDLLWNHYKSEMPSIKHTKVAV